LSELEEAQRGSSERSNLDLRRKERWRRERE